MDTESIIFSIGPLAIPDRWLPPGSSCSWAHPCCALATSGSIDPGACRPCREGVVSTIHAAIEDTLPGYGERLLPFIGSLWIFIAIANLVGVLPGAASPAWRPLHHRGAGHRGVPLENWFGIRSEGLGAYLRHYMQPSLISDSVSHHQRDRAPWRWRCGCSAM